MVKGPGVAHTNDSRKSKERLETPNIKGDKVAT